jgi:anti-sigma regulatory factor (Ser/Thr protein kinase)
LVPAWCITLPEATHGGAVDTAVSIRLTISPDRVTAEVVDGGMMFDPCVERNLNTSAGVEDLPEGGWGLLLAQRVTEGLAYERVGEQNRTTFSISRAPACRNARADGIG